MELVLKTSEQKCFVGSNPTASAIVRCRVISDSPNLAGSVFKTQDCWSGAELETLFPLSNLVPVKLSPAPDGPSSYLASSVRYSRNISLAYPPVADKETPCVNQKSKTQAKLWHARICRSKICMSIKEHSEIGNFLDSPIPCFPTHRLEQMLLDFSRDSSGNMRRVLLTGGAGYIGSVLAPMLVRAGFSVMVIDRCFFGNPFSKDPEIQVINKDTRDISRLDLVGVTDVIDMAAISNDPSGDLVKTLTMEINFRARSSLQRLCVEAGVGRYVLASSTSVYGYRKDEATEESDLNPLTTYAEANALAEQSALGLSGFGTLFTCLRQATVYGPSRRMRYDLVVNAMALSVVQGQPIKILGDGMQWRPVVHVTDTARAIVALLKAPDRLVSSQIYNVGSDAQNHTILELGQIVAGALGKELRTESYGVDDPRSYKVSFEKIRKALGFDVERDVSQAAREISAGNLDRSLLPQPESYTVSKYKELIEGGILR
jgi:nucleoside-diphosphate-sugar epimerase